MQNTGTIILAGATGNLGHRIAGQLLLSGARVVALVRKGSANRVKLPGTLIKEVDFGNRFELAAACAGGSCLVSALQGLEDVILGVQGQLLQAALDAGVPRFIPSDYSIDYTRLPEGSNRNLDLRRRFHEQLDKAPITATSILNGCFTEILVDPAPVILFKPRRVLYWGDAEQLLDFTTMDDTAAYTARAAVDTATPRYLRIAGDVVNIKDLQQVAEAITGEKFRLLRPGGLSAFALVIRLTRLVKPQKKEVFPVWQGMQYLHNMFTGLPKFHQLDNHRYPNIRWTGVQDFLAAAMKRN